MKRSSPRSCFPIASTFLVVLFFSTVLTQSTYAQHNKHKIPAEKHTNAQEEKSHSTPQPDAGDAHTYEYLPTGGIRVTRRTSQEHDKIVLDLTSDGFHHAARVLEKAGQQGASRRALAAAARLTSGGQGGRAAWYDGKRWCLTSAHAVQSVLTTSTRDAHDKQDYYYTQQIQKQVSDTCNRDVSSCTRDEIVSKNANIAPWLLDSNSIDAALRGYATHHERIIRAIKAGKYPRKDIRVAVYRPSHYGEGFGNRVLALVSVLAWCMVTGRVMLVDWTSSYALRYVVGVDLEWEYEHVKDLLQGMYECVYVCMCVHVCMCMFVWLAWIWSGSMSM
jgi:hypothetical protein